MFVLRSFVQSTEAHIPYGQFILLDEDARAEDTDERPGCAWIPVRDSRCLLEDSMSHFYEQVVSQLSYALEHKLRWVNKTPLEFSVV